MKKLKMAEQSPEVMETSISVKQTKEMLDKQTDHAAMESDQPVS